MSANINDMVKEQAKEAWLEAWFQARGEETMNPVTKDAATSRFERWWDKNE